MNPGSPIGISVYSSVTDAAADGGSFTTGELIAMVIICVVFTAVLGSWSWWICKDL